MKILVLTFTILAAQACASLKSHLTRSNFEAACQDSQSVACPSFLARALTELLACPSLSLTSNTSNFLGGFFEGLRKDASAPSQCLNSVTPLNVSTDALSALVATFGKSFDVLLVYDILYSFNQFMNDLVSLYELCAIQFLIDKVVAVGTRDGFAFIVLRLGTHFDTIVDGVDFGVRDLNSGDYEKAGRNFGVAAQFLFDFGI